MIGLTTCLGGLSAALIATFRFLKRPALEDARIANNQPPVDTMSGLYAIGGVGALVAFGFLHQLYAYKNKDKPILIINEKGLWYDGVWFKRNIFCAWKDIEHITFLSSGSLHIWSRSHFPFIVTIWELDVNPK